MDPYVSHIFCTPVEPCISSYFHTTSIEDPILIKTMGIYHQLIALRLDEKIMESQTANQMKIHLERASSNLSDFHKQLDELFNLPIFFKASYKGKFAKIETYVNILLRVSNDNIESQKAFYKKHFYFYYLELENLMAQPILEASRSQNSIYNNLEPINNQILIIYANFINLKLDEKIIESYSLSEFKFQLEFMHHHLIQLQHQLDKVANIPTYYQACYKSKIETFNSFLKTLLQIPCDELKKEMSVQKLKLCEYYQEFENFLLISPFSESSL